MSATIESDTGMLVRIVENIHIPSKTVRICNVTGRIYAIMETISI